ncbi:unnamed protein product [Chironomus riparius]|uniref:Secreted protein n=1 Tax=Chironomus riparius TaxID=315576 RepID=A0A9N9WZI0_9DIPT|nr:unnamed protein product [Chironomus riparius]
MKFNLILSLFVAFAIFSLSNAGGPSDAWIEHCRTVCMVCSPEPYDPNCDCEAIFGARSVANAGTPSWESSWGPSFSPSWLEYCQQACMLCGPVPFDPLCDCELIFGVKCSPLIDSSSSESESSSTYTESLLQSISESP